MRSIIAFSLLLTIQLLSGQAYLVFESSGQIRLRKYPIGSEIRVHFKGEPRSNWMNYTIWDLDLKSNCIRVSDTYCIPLIALDGFDLSPQGGNALAALSGKFLIPWVFFSGVQEATRNIFKPPLPPLGPFHFIVAGTAAAVWIYAILFQNGQKRLNKRHRLRLIDLTMDVPKT